MAWFYLLAAAVFEMGWIYSLKFTEGFTRFGPTIAYGFLVQERLFFFPWPYDICPWELPMRFG
jgi:multidrug transporter EmrE-like cation transporter